jgi:Fic family protein
VSVGDRVGRYVSQPTGYRAFIPAPLPPQPPIRLDDGLVMLLSEADQALGRLDGIAQMLPNPDLFVAMYVRREAVLSSQIEGTQSTLEDLLGFELDPRGREVPQDVEEVVNYVRAMNHGLERLATLPLSLRLLREIHRELLTGVRGAERDPGEFRRSQNWIGPAGVSLAHASFVPPPVYEMHQALDNLEKFLHDRQLPILIHCALVHNQFETIHPFLDGNGRVGRLLITLQLCERGVLQRPLLYLSHYFRRHRAEYYDRLQNVRQTGDWEGWLRFFLRGVAETASEASFTGRAIVALRETHRALVQDSGLGSGGLRLLDLLFGHPIVSATFVAERLGVAFRTANKLIARLERLGLVVEVTGHQRNRRYRYAPYLALFEEQPVEPPDALAASSEPGAQ